MNRDREERIAAIAARQYGVVTRRQLLDAGLSPAAVGRRVSQARLRRLHRGVYLLGPLEPPGAREMAAVLAGGPTAVLSHLNAAQLWGLTGKGQVRGTKAEPVHITVEGRNRGHRPGIRAHRVSGLAPDERTVRRRIPVTTPARTVVDMASTVGSRELEGIVSRAERQGLLERTSWAALMERHHRRRGISMLRTVLDLERGPMLTRSEAESAFLALVRTADLPPPETNVRMGPYELDFLWRHQKIAVEVDGYRYHSPRPRFEGDRRKDAWLVARGIKVIRLTWRQVTEEAVATAVQVGQALAAVPYPLSRHAANRRASSASSST